MEKKEAPTWHPCEVADSDVVEIRRIETRVGPSRSDLVDMLEGTTPEELGMKLEPLERADGTPYRGVLMPDPQNPWPRFEYCSIKRLSTKCIKMEAQQQVHESQPTDTMNYIKHAAIEDDAMRKALEVKLRRTPWTFDAMIKKADETRIAAGIPPLQKLPLMLKLQQAGTPAPSPLIHPPVAQAPAPSVAPSGGDDSAKDEDDDIMDDDADDGASEGGGTQLGSVVSGHIMLNAKAVADSISVLGRGLGGKRGRASLSDGEGSRGNTVSPGAKKGRVKVDQHGVPLLDPDKQELVERRTSSADVQQILAGVPMGREMRWLKDTRDMFQNASLKKYADPLTEHFNLCEHAQVLIDGPIAKISKNQLHVAIEMLQEAQEPLPATMQREIFQREVTEFMQHDPQHVQVEAFMDLVLPFNAEAGDNKGKHDGLHFNGVSPRLWALQDSPGESGRMFQQLVIDFLVAGIALGSSRQAMLLQISNQMLHYLQDSVDCDAAEAFDTDIGELIRDCRFLKSLADPRCVHHAPEVEDVAKLGGKKGKASKATPSHQLWLAVKSSDFWWARYGEFDKKHAETGKHLPAIDALSEKAKAMDTCTFVAEGYFKQLMEHLPDFIANCRAGVFEHLVTVAEETMLTELSRWEREGFGVDSTSPRCMQALDACAATLELAAKALPKLDAKLEAGRRHIDACRAKLSSALTATGFTTQASQATAEDLSNEDFRRQLHLAVQGLVHSETEASPEMGESLTHVATVCAEHLKNATAWSDIEPVLDLIGDMKRVASWPTMGEDFEAIIKMLSTWMPL